MKRADLENLCSRRVAIDAREKDLLVRAVGFTFWRRWSSLTRSLNVAEKKGFHVFCAAINFLC